MNLVLDAFERVLYPTGEAAARRRRASTSGLATALTGPIGTGVTRPAGHHHHHPTHHQQQQLLQRQVGGQQAYRRRSGHHSPGPSAAGRRETGGGGGQNNGNSGGRFMTICQSNSLSGLNRHQQQSQQQQHPPDDQILYTEAAMQQQAAGGGTPTSGRSRSSAATGGRRKKSMMHVQRKQSVASLLFSALASPTPIPGENNSRIRRRQSRAATANAPPRQWSVPERTASAEDEDQQEEEEEPFCLVQKTNSLALSSPGGRSPPIRQMSGDEPVSPHSMGTLSPLLPFPCQAAIASGPVLLGFVPPPTPQPVSASFRPLTGRRRPSESNCLNDWARLRGEPGLSQALLLRCVDPEPAFPFLQYAGLSDQEQSLRLCEELAQAGHGQFGCYEELFALEKTASSKLVSGGFRGSEGTIVGQQQHADEEPGSSTQQQHHQALTQQIHSGGSMSPTPDSPAISMSNGQRQQQHRGFIVICFRLLDEHNDNGSPGSGSTTGGSSELESSWLSWTGAGQIYRYSPRAWALHRLSLLRRVHHSSSSSSSSTNTTTNTSAPFAYVLVCEFGAILHPSNALAALDMCERLRARNCGLVALYQVRQSFTGASGQPPQHHCSVHSLTGSVPSSSLSPHWSPHQVRRQQLGRMGRSQDERGRQGGGGGGGGSLLRLIRAREGSLGWDQQQQAPPVQTQVVPAQPASSTVVGAIGQQQHWRGEPGIGTTL